MDTRPSGSKDLKLRVGDGDASELLDLVSTHLYFRSPRIHASQESIALVLAALPKFSIFLAASIGVFHSRVKIQALLQ